LHTLSQSNRTLIHATSANQLVADITRVMVDSASYDAVWLALTDGARFDLFAALGPCDSFGSNIERLWREEAEFRARVGDVVSNNAAHQRLLKERDLEYLCDELCRGCAVNSLMLPVASGESMLGVLGVYSLDMHAFSLDELSLLQELAGDIAFGITSLRTREERDRARGALDKVLFQTIEAIGLTVEKRDPYTAGHQQRVAELATAIGRAMGLAEQRLTGLRLGAVIHDIGKVYVPSEILNRPGKLSENEFGMIKSHPEVGYDIIKGVDFPWPVAQMICQHHERLDGSGYPAGLKGDEIILESRILAVADVMEAITSHRPYRPALGKGHGLEVVMAGRGTLFDAAVVNTCVALFESGGFEWEVAG
jgi:putative nucleotidyltransferase with HDIG domain